MLKYKFFLTQYEVIQAIANRPQSMLSFFISVGIITFIESLCYTFLKTEFLNGQE